MAAITNANPVDTFSVTTAAQTVYECTGAGKTIFLKNNGTATIYIGRGKVTVSSSNGYPLAVGQEMIVPLSTAERITAIAGSTQDLRVALFGLPRL